MSDMGDTFNAWKKLKRAKKSSNMEFSTRLLEERNIKFESKNNGVHLVVKHNNKIADFWPSTGKFKIRGSASPYYLRGIKKLIEILNRQ